MKLLIIKIIALINVIKISMYSAKDDTIIWRQDINAQQNDIQEDDANWDIERQILRACISTVS